MSIDCSSILSLAQELAAQEGETHLRSAVSRAYYASLHRVEMALPQRFEVSDEDRKGRSSHESVIQALVAWGKSIAPGRQNARVAALKMPRLKAARLKADYYLDETVTKEEVQFALAAASEVFRHMAETDRRSEVAEG